MVAAQAVRLIVLSAIAYVVFVVLVALPFWDWGQCTRKCRLDHLGPASMDDASVTGRRAWPWEWDLNSDKDEHCMCFSSSSSPSNSTWTLTKLPAVPRIYESLPPGFPYPSSDKRVCGMDGRQFTNAAAAAKAGVKVVNCGPCGSCSTVHDKQMTVLLSRCAIVYLFLGETLARKCLAREFAAAGGFTPACEVGLPIFTFFRSLCSWARIG